MRKFAVLILMTAILMTAGCAAAEHEITLTFLGDCTLGCEERLMEDDNAFLLTAEREGYAYFFENVASLLSEDDLTIANLECVLKKDTYGIVEKTYNFRGLPAFANILTLGSVELVDLENNHTQDYDYLGERSTRTALDEEGIAYFDSEDVYIYEKDGIQIAFLGVWERWTYTYGTEYCELIQSLKESGVNAVVVCMHAGVEYSETHSENQEKLAHKFIDAGADLIIGHHPHVVQGAEIYENRLILYSLGNFVFGGNTQVRALETIIPRITFTFSDDGELLGTSLRIYPANVSGDSEENDYQPLLVTGEAAEAVYALLDQASDAETAPQVEIQTDSYRDYEWIDANAVNDENSETTDEDTDEDTTDDTTETNED